MHSISDFQYAANSKKTFWEFYSEWKENLLQNFIMKKEH
jgi:hypothetical protein